MPHTGSFRSVGSADWDGAPLPWWWCSFMSMSLFPVVVDAPRRLPVPVMTSMASMAMPVHQMHQRTGEQQQVGPVTQDMAPVLTQQEKARDQGHRCQRHAGRAAPERWRLGVVVRLIHGTPFQKQKIFFSGSHP